MYGLPVVTALVVSSYLIAATYSMTTTEILRAYRHLYRTALRAVRHSSPAKYQIRDTMRSAFRNGSVETLNRQKVENTLQFLRRAESHAGMEHKILQNLLHVRYWQNQGRRDNRLLVTSSKPVLKVLTKAGLISRLISPRQFERIAGLSLMQH